MGWALLFIASAGTGATGLLLCVVMGVMYTLGFILTSAGKLGMPSLELPESDHDGLTSFVDFLPGEVLTVETDSTRTAMWIVSLRERWTQQPCGLSTYSPRNCDRSSGCGACAGVVGSLLVGMLLTCVAFWCFLAACVTGFMCAGAGFGANFS